MSEALHDMPAYRRPSGMERRAVSDTFAGPRHALSSSDPGLAAMA
ncbi:hypothetical protein C7453_107102 [Gluconacetobacter liquefaciens]|uniref:Uncharacterized protein n=1 Tax=Gluconacetobacter liquefaciens TaxID=89584 RepID=A0A370G258_GLULI|nr:hypothetical protein C7453_107102 [Gluconacetobacter liquefaciens]